MNSVDVSNFNDTCKGYVVRALRIMNEDEKLFDDETIKKIFNGLRWSFDEMTMEDARMEYESYLEGKINF